MKRFLASFLALILLASLAACGGDSTNNNQTLGTETLEENFFTFDYPTDETSIDFFVDNDDFETLAMAGPYYVGQKESFGTGLGEYDAELQKKINEAISLTTELFQKELELKNGLQNLKKSYNDMWAIVLEENKDYGPSAKESAEILIANQIKLETLVATYNSVIIETENKATQANLEYLKTSLALNLSESVSQDFSDFLALVSVSIFEFEESENDNIKKAAENFDKAMADIEDLTVKYSEMQELTLKLDLTLRQINTAQYYMGLASANFIAKKLPELQNMIDGAVANENLTEEDIDFLKSYAEFYGLVAEDLQNILAEVDPNTLVEVSQNTGNNFLITTAFAEEERVYISQAFDSFKQGEYKKGFKTMLKSNWQTLKEQAKQTRKVVAGTAEMMKTGFKSAADYFWGKVEGNTNKEISDQIDENVKEMQENIRSGKAGAEIFTTAEEYFNWIEKQGGNIAEGGTEMILGEGNTSWLMGHVGKMTVNMFTGFGKGVTKVFNPDSSDGEIAEGMLDVGLSFIGGTKAIGTGSQFMSGAKESFKLAGKKGINFLGNLFTSKHIKNLRNISAEILKNKKLTADQIKLLYENASRIATNKEIQKDLLNISKNLNDEFLDLLKAGKDTFLSNATTGAKESYREFVEKTFKNSLEGYREALTAVLGDGMEAYIDNLVANKLDDMLKTTVKEYIDNGVIPGLGGPYDGKYTGNINADELQIPLELTVIDNAISVQVKYHLAVDGGVLTLNATGSGTVNPDSGAAEIKYEGNFKLVGKDADLYATLNGNFDGNFNEAGANFNMTGVASVSGTFWGKPVKEGAQNIDPLPVSLNKVSGPE